MCLGEASNHSRVCPCLKRAYFEIDHSCTPCSPHGEVARIPNHDHNRTAAETSLLKYEFIYVHIGSMYYLTKGSNLHLKSPLVTLSALVCHVTLQGSVLHVTTLPGAVTCCDVSSVTGSQRREAGEVFTKLKTIISSD